MKNYGIPAIRENYATSGQENRFETCFKDCARWMDEWMDGCCRDPVVGIAPFSYFVWQRGYFHPFPLTVGILIRLLLPLH